MFEHPPVFLQPFLTALANLSRWFDWNALEAIGTVGALWFAVIQSGRSARLERLRAIGILTTLIGLIEPLSEAVPDFPGAPSDKLQRDDVAFLARGAWDLAERAQKGLEHISHAEIVEAGVAEWVGGVNMALSLLKEALPRSSTKAVYNHQLNSIAYIREAVEHFRDQRDFLRYGRAGTFARRAVNRLSWAIWSRRYRKKTRHSASS